MVVPTKGHKDEERASLDARAFAVIFAAVSLPS
jgi:hypothetical protein